MQVAGREGDGARKSVTTRLDKTTTNYCSRYTTTRRPKCSNALEALLKSAAAAVARFFFFFFFFFLLAVIIRKTFFFSKWKERELSSYLHHGPSHVFIISIIFLTSSSS